MENKLIVSSSPHIRSNKDTSLYNEASSTCTLPAALACTIFFQS